MTGFYGDTLLEAFGKALGRRDEHGRPTNPRTRLPLSHKQFEPTELTGPELQEFLRPMRDAALGNATSYLAGLYDEDNPDEIGYSEWYNRLTGAHRQRPMPDAGQPVRDANGNPHFEFAVYGKTSGWEILALGHTHPPTSGHGMVGTESGRGRPSDNDLSDSDKYLNRFGPMILISPDHPFGREFKTANNHYESWEEVNSGRLRTR